MGWLMGGYDLPRGVYDTSEELCGTIGRCSWLNSRGLWHLRWGMQDDKTVFMIYLGGLWLGMRRTIGPVLKLGPDRTPVRVRVRKKLKKKTRTGPDNPEKNGRTRTGPNRTGPNRKSPFFNHICLLFWHFIGSSWWKEWLQCNLQWKYSEKWLPKEMAKMALPYLKSVS